MLPRDTRQHTENAEWVDARSWELAPIISAACPDWTEDPLASLGKEEGVMEHCCSE